MRIGGGLRECGGDDGKEYRIDVEMGFMVT